MSLIIAAIQAGGGGDGRGVGGGVGGGGDSDDPMISATELHTLQG